MNEIYNSDMSNSKMTNIFGKTFFLMFLGLLATGVISWYTYSSGLLENILETGKINLLLIGELIFVFVFSLVLRKLPVFLVQILFFAYAILNGMTMSVIFAVYQLSSITIVFFASAILFGIFALYGYFTKADLSRIWPMLIGTMLVGIIVSIINIFIGNSMLDVIVSWVLLFVFFGVTAYDIQRLKYEMNAGIIDLEKLPIYFAMQLYLDFINIFLRVLELFGRRR